MENELLQQLGGKIDQLLDEMELLRMELNEVRTERDNLLAQQSQSTETVKALLSRFDKVTDAA